MSCQACTRGFHKHCRRCDCCKPKAEPLICKMQDDGKVCGKPAQRYPLGNIGVQTVCLGHHLKFLMLLGALMQEPATSPD